MNNPYMLHLLYTDQHYHPDLHGIYLRFCFFVFWLGYSKIYS